MIYMLQVMTVHPEAANDILLPQGDVPVNLISIFGAARGGKVCTLFAAILLSILSTTWQPNSRTPICTCFVSTPDCCYAMLVLSPATSHLSVIFYNLA
jgi:hypothetical protein